MNTIIKKLDHYRKPELIYNLVFQMPYCAILDSSLCDFNNGFSIIGLNPYYVLKEENHLVYGNDFQLARSFDEELSDYIVRNQEKNDSILPLISGGIGYITYDYGCKFESIPISNISEITMPDALFCFYDNFIVIDLNRKEVYITAKGMLKDASQSIEELESMMISADKKIEINESRYAEFSFDFTKEEYLDAVHKMIDHIIEGDIYIANLTQQMIIKSDLMPYHLFLKMREKNPSPFGGYFHYPDFDIVSASPERFIRMKDRFIETKPIKGTRKRGIDKEDDLKFRNELETSEKDHSELLMIVDLERNDLNRICETGSVKVKKLFDIESFSTVFHLVSTINGKMREDLSFGDLIHALFPGGSITGAPKIEAMKIIDRLEHSARGLYTGSLGYISLNGDCDFNIVIRTAIWQKGVYHMGIGGGITFESNPEAEYEETLQKAKAFVDILKGDQ